ncbi:TolC family protein [Marinoscillum sp. 108]|uniref:TolC family protein n=1 Tax=Marinoscillum sp. 108 TaxID=2653151 RepID=UPI0012F2502D|nr:TolC family protein [Marinoscillum sp. 108]VXD13697.1 Transporter [Marinoscillum sp. 108]
MRYLTIVFLLLGSLVSAQTLQEYQQEASENNPMLQSKYKEFEAALQRVTQVKGFPDPTLSVSAFGRMTETRVGRQMARFTLSQMFPWFGTLKVQGEATALIADAAFERYIDEQNKLWFQVSRAYYPLVELEDVLSIQRGNLDILKSWKTLATSKYENGKTSLADVLRVDLMIQDMETEIILLEGMKRPLTASFNQLLNRPDSMEVFTSPFDSVSVPVYSEQVNWNDHPLLKEITLKKQSKEKQYMAIEKQSMPKLGVGLDYIIVAERTDLAAGQAGMNVPGNGQDAIMPMITVSLPLYRRKYKAALKENKLQTESIELMAQSTRNELNASFENVKYDVMREIEMLNLYEIQIEETQRIQSLLVSEFGNSGKDLVELLRIQMQLLNYQKLEIKSKTKLFIALANLDYILGGTQ